MRGRCAALITLLVLVLASVPQAEESSPSVGETCVEVVRAYVTDVYANRMASALARVRGVEAEDLGSKFERLLLDSISLEDYEDLSECSDNLFALAGAIEARSGKPLASLDELVGPGTVFPRGMPRCPALGQYRLARTEDGGYRIWCGTDAHESIGIGGNFPEFSSLGGLSLNNQELKLVSDLRFEVEDWSLEVEALDEERGLARVRHREKSRLGGPRQPVLERSSSFMLSSQDGQWRIDLALSNRDMVFLFDEDEWSRTATLPRQVLFYYQVSESMGFRSPDIEDRPRLELRICEANLRSLSLAVEEWSVQHAGAYPTSALEVVTPKFLREMPRCPAGGQYRYRIEPPGSYRIWCDGNRHQAAGVPTGYPALTPVLGVIERP
jgi:hypothetical protein